MFWPKKYEKNYRDRLPSRFVIDFKSKKKLLVAKSEGT